MREDVVQGRRREAQQGTAWAWLGGKCARRGRDATTNRAPPNDDARRQPPYNGGDNGHPSLPRDARMGASTFGVGAVRATAARFRFRRPSAMTPRVGLNRARKGAGPLSISSRSRRSTY